MEQVKSSIIEPERSEKYLSNTLKRIASAFATLIHLPAYKAEIARYEREVQHQSGGTEER